ncbi:hypothetical protein K402DRAFT_462862 [Aulographum hederae CBS 113979]|uniref:Uncharacterized protein n=1 Tax=Aulographum hederae CBS 113979 TaxID=1176131 RepID=A0A6G1H3D5_9PEZI|nr:hypothetical protein K402DRAFT_462862 [Aulographum hederae CBS 113979]
MESCRSNRASRSRSVFPVSQPTPGTSTSTTLTQPTADGQPIETFQVVSIPARPATAQDPASPNEKSLRLFSKAATNTMGAARAVNAASRQSVVRSPPGSGLNSCASRRISGRKNVGRGEASTSVLNSLPTNFRIGQSRKPTVSAPRITIKIGWSVLTAYPTVIKKGEDWVEVDCPCCHSNVSVRGNRSATWLKGPGYIVVHAKKGPCMKESGLSAEDITPEWVAQNGQVRVLAPEDIHEFLRGGQDRLGMVQRSPKQFFLSGQTGQLSRPHTAPAQSNKRSREDTNPPVEPSSSKSKRQKRAGGKMGEKKLGNRVTAKLGKMARRMTSANHDGDSTVSRGQSSIPDTNLAHFCPCELSDHPCGDTSCRMPKICRRLAKHDGTCVFRGHGVKPTCPDLVDLVSCECTNPGVCKFGHGQPEVRIHIEHSQSCSNHNVEIPDED